MDFDEVVRALEAGQRLEPWRPRFAESIGADGLVWDPVELRRRCDWIGLDERVRAVLLDAAGEIADDVVLRRLAEHVAWLVYDAGDDPVLAPWPALPDHLADVGRLLYAATDLALVGRAIERFERRGVPERIVRATLADLGRKVEQHRRLYGRWGMAEQSWLTHHLLGRIVEVGRLQYQISVHWQRVLGSCPLAPMAPVLDLHVPADEPLDPAAVDDSIAQTVELVAACWPGFAWEAMVCRSWLLDPALADLLPPASNLVRFQQRFVLASPDDAVDPEWMKWIFWRLPGTPLDELPQRTTLQRAIVGLVRAGGRLRCGFGWFDPRPG